MGFAVHAEVPPFREDQAGAIRVGESRVLLEIVIHALQDGATPETIVQRYDTLALQDVYSVIAYYLRHRREIEEYLEKREQEADAVQGRIEAAQPDMSEIRARLTAARKK
ncbi:MAG TPA: DUF433 domain-containing protein [Humisphaera sp.]|jgi:uncharacterized protein (DUF433 family)|nr:DUF433 domain-containing protein [Humisphaera sp.]